MEPTSPTRVPDPPDPGPAGSSDPAPHHVIVVGAGVAGLVAARDLARSGVRVSVLESADRVGGQIRTVDFAGRRVDVGAEAVFVAPPHLSALVREVGLWDTAVSAQHGVTLLGHPRGAVPMPEGLTPAGPSRLRPVLRSRILSWPGVLRAGLEPLTSRICPPLAPDQDISVGDFLTARFGDEVVRRLVDPLLGSLYSGDVHRISLRGATPQLVGAAEHRTSLVRRRASRQAGGPSFINWPDGMETFVRALTSDIEGHGGQIATGVAVREIVPASGRWQVRTTTGTYETDRVVLATPAPVIADLLAGLRGGAADVLAEQRSASVGNVVLAVSADRLFDPAAARADDLELRADRRTTGLLVPSEAPWLLKAATFLSTKWPHLARTSSGEDDGSFLLRLSAGRIGDERVDGLSDDELIARLTHDLHQATGVTPEVRESLVVRWPVMPQVEVGQPARIAQLRADLAEHLPGLVLAGSGVDGLGLAAVTRSGRQAAAALTGVRG